MPLPERGAGYSAIGRRSDFTPAGSQAAAQIMANRLVDKHRQTLAIENAQRGRLDATQERVEVRVNPDVARQREQRDQPVQRVMRRLVRDARGVGVGH